MYLGRRANCTWCWHIPSARSILALCCFILLLLLLRRVERELHFRRFLLFALCTLPFCTSVRLPTCRECQFFCVCCISYVYSAVRWKIQVRKRGKNYGMGVVVGIYHWIALCVTYIWASDREEWERNRNGNRNGIREMK